MIKLRFVYYYTIILTAILFTACNNEPKEIKEQPVTKTVEKKIATPTFNQDSAYAFIQAQVDFGPRVPGSKAHASCANYLTSKLKSYNFEVMVQKATLKTFDKKQFILKNIIASFKPELQNRVLICAHWDTRPWADADTENNTKPFDGANDGASGVGVALEMARQINAIHPAIGLDIIFFDLEDYGETNQSNNEENSWWCLGSKYWAKNLHVPNYYANYGILLDMVGGANAIFPKEGNSVTLASTIVDKVWNTANTIGYGNYFSPQRRDFIGEDDHIYVNQAGIPCIDIIEYNQATGGFGSYHHTHKDNMDIIDKNTLKAVGQTLLEVIYNEK